MKNRDHSRLDILYRLFPRLSRENQGYVLGVTEGLRYAQGRLPGAPGGRDGAGREGSLCKDSLKGQVLSFF